MPNPKRKNVAPNFGEPPTLAGTGESTPKNTDDPRIAKNGPLVTIDLGAIAANTEYLADRAGVPLIAVVKADGYGHGAVAVARTALRHGACGLGVAAIADAFELRAAGIDAPIVSWLNPVSVDWDRALRERIEVAVGSLEHLEAARAAGRRERRPARIHLQIDVGMCRDGAPAYLWRSLAEHAATAQRADEIRVVGIMGHLGRADSADGDPEGLAAFAHACAVLAAAGIHAPRHLAATAALLTDPQTRLDAVRVGAGIVGIDPSGSTTVGPATTLCPAMTLRAPVVAVRRVPADAWVGYGRNFRTFGPRWLATIPVGYADGLPRAASTSAEVFLAGARRRVAGLISMEQTVIDLGMADRVCPVGPGDVAVVFGPGIAGEPTVADWARAAGTLSHEIVTGVGRCVRRQWIQAQA